jgi:hypothetical protein
MDEYLNNRRTREIVISWLYQIAAELDTISSLTVITSLGLLHAVCEKTDIPKQYPNQMQQIASACLLISSKLHDLKPNAVSPAILAVYSCDESNINRDNMLINIAAMISILEIAIYNHNYAGLMHASSMQHATPPAHRIVFHACIPRWTLWKRASPLFVQMVTYFMHRLYFDNVTMFNDSNRMLAVVCFISKWYLRHKIRPTRPHASIHGPEPMMIDIGNDNDNDNDNDNNNNAGSVEEIDRPRVVDNEDMPEQAIYDYFYPAWILRESTD